MSTFQCNYATLKQVAGDYIKALPNATFEEMEAGMKCVGLHFLGFEAAAPHEEAGAQALLRIVARLHIQREVQLMQHVQGE